MSKQFKAVWNAPADVANPESAYFLNTADGNANRICIAKLKFEHYRKATGTNQFALSSMCVPFQMDQTCKNGNRCTFNHRSRKGLSYLQNSATTEKVEQLYSIFVVLYR